MIRQNKYISILFAICFATILFSGNVLGQYEGGEGPGFSYAEETQTCVSSSIFKGSSGDGFDYLSYLQTCQSRLFSVGGQGNGFSVDTNLRMCPVENIYTGNSNAGYAYGISSSCPDDSVSIEAVVLAQPLCTTPSLGWAMVSVVDGYPTWESVPDFTYVWKDENGDTLSGYPLVKSSMYDTLTNIAVGVYTVVVTDANMKSDSAVIYINDCLYRGGSGNGYSADTSTQDCATLSIYTNNGNDGADMGSNYSNCNSYLYSQGGSGNGFAVDTTTSICLPAQIYTGESGDGLGSIEETLICESKLFSVGGEGNGFSVDTLTQDCEPLNIFTSTGSDGFDYDIDILTCESNLFTQGGDGSGFAVDTSTQNCDPLNIYTNSGGDGYDYVTDILSCESVLFTQGGDGNGFAVDTSTQVCDNPAIYSGNEGSGFSHVYNIPCLKDSMVIVADILNQITCPITANNGSAHVSITDGFPDFRSVSNYTFTWKNSSGTILTGYPKITNETADTIYNLGVDDYTIIVTDALGNTDSSIIYINDCLYRGGDGSGATTDSTLNNCLLPSIYQNAGGDGFDYLIEVPNCNFGLYSSGGNGNGFAVDTSTSDCSPVSIYKNSGDDGFDYVADILDCSMTLFSSGSDGSGFAFDSANQVCELPTVSKGELGDGSDQLYDGCTPYIYELPSTNNSCLIADTISSDGSNQWQLILRNGQIVASIKDNGNALGEVTTQFYVNDNSVRIDPFGILPSYYLNRNYKISVENLIFGSPVRVRLYFLSNELQTLINADDNVTGITSIGITRYHGTNENCQLTDNIDNNDNINYLHYNSYDYDIYENGYYVEFEVNSFSEFYINNSSSLPTPYEITADLDVTSDYNGSDVSCYGSSDGEATITPTYGIAPFAYQWDDPLSQTDSIATNLSAGTYRVTIVDNNSVTYTDSITITQPDTIRVSSVITSACQGKNDGTVDLTTLGGTTPPDYSYSWSTSDGSGIIAGDEDQFSLSGGTYNITIEDANLCSKDTTVTIQENLVSTAATSINSTNNNTCQGTTKSLSPNGGILGYNSVWRWYADASFSTLLYTGDTYNVDPASSTSYWLRAEGDCDTSSSVNVTVSVLAASVVANTIAKSADNVTAGTNVILDVRGGLLGDGASWNWYLDASGTSSAGPVNDSLFVAPVVTTQYWVRAEGSCNTTAMVTTTLTINPAPLKPATPVGVDSTCQDDINATYTTTGASGATSYIWTITPSSAGSITGTGTSALVDWSASFYGAVSITVTGENASGTGPESDPMNVWIWKTPETGSQYHINNMNRR